MRGCASGTTARWNRKNYIVPGLIAVILLIIAALLTSLTIAREWEMGTMEQLLSTPLRPAEMVLGKMLAYFVVGVADAAIAVLVGVFVFDVPLRGSLLLLAVSTLRVPVRRAVLGDLRFGGGQDAVAGLPDGNSELVSAGVPALRVHLLDREHAGVIQVITHIVPARYVVTILKGIFLKGVGLEVLWGELVFLALYALIVFRAGHAQAEPEAGVNAMWERIRVILRKEFIQALREPRMRVLLFVPPMVQLIIFGFAVNLDVDHARIAWMDMDRTPESRDLRAASPGRAGSTSWPTPASEEDVQRALDRGEAQAVVRVLPGFARDTARGRTDGGAGAGRRHQLQYRVAGLELRGVDHRGLFGGRDGAAAARQGADAQSRVAGERGGAAGDGAQPRLVQSRSLQPQLLRPRAWSPTSS